LRIFKVKILKENIILTETFLSQCIIFQLTFIKKAILRFRSDTKAHYDLAAEGRYLVWKIEGKAAKCFCGWKNYILILFFSLEEIQHDQTTKILYRKLEKIFPES
jgi:hypothetical protein